MAAAVSVVGSLLFVLLIFLSLFPAFCLSRSDADSLLQFKKSLKNGDSKLNNWIPGWSHCRKKWVGVKCRGETITGLHLTNLGLTGSVDVEPLTKLSSLRTISLVNNSFTGPIPEFNKLGALKAIYISNNRFSGDIRDDYFGSMGSLKKVWLNDNNFTGKIPSSLMKLPHLMELHLEENQFSGKIPELTYPGVIKSLNLTGNQLEGNIPESFSKFNASTFDRNVKLCGKQFMSHCVRQSIIDKSASPSTASIIITSVTLVVVFFFVIVGMASTSHDEDDNMRNLSSSRESLRHIQVVSGSIRTKSIESSRKSSLSLKIKRGSSQRADNKNRTDDFIMVNGEKVAFGMEDLMKASAEMLENGVLGSAYKAVMGNGLTVVVKRTREMNKLGKDGFGVEIKRFGDFRHPNVLAPLAFHFKRDEKLIVSEYMPCGNLLYALHGDRGLFHARLNWQNRLKVIKGIAEGLGYIHTQLATYVVPHGNLKTSNVLLTETYDPLLNDYGFHPFVNSDDTSRGLFAYKSPECLQNQQYISPKSDVYCLGVVILEIMTGKYPSQYLNNYDGGIDIVQWAQSSTSENQVEELIDPEILSSGSVNQMVKMIRIGVACTISNPDQRLNLNDVISNIQEVN
ncbi:pollen receptor like kinase 3 [Hibiscus trionum]|uniref:Pollen receptor like kinase 3 n=1 Tax=Hibiscus trionum TaxID=183268 RepID=A0A9W7I6C7_HIBTR|nr:pollen receptor like kinase 3 [Hibiscus trionum]